MEIETVACKLRIFSGHILLMDRVQGPIVDIRSKIQLDSS